uniref:TIR domain-containing protein n=1 Tax=Neogobius melanostomus TaxID=47308 RepID=A0A8C6U4H5_9GOBI
MDTESLKGLINLKTLIFENYCCVDYDEDKFIYFSHGPRLFLPLTDLKVLDVTNSHVESLDFLVEANLTKLEMLILKNNVLTVINETIFKALPSLKYLDLSGNPFVCNCSNTGFIEWTIRNKQVQVANAFQYRCSSPSSEEGNFLLDFNVRLCWEFTGFLYFISSSALVLLTLLSSFIFHFLRWQLVYGYYLLLAFLYDSKKRRQGCPHIYDAFVSYNVHDEDWVYGELLHELEERQGWKLCLHHRDFIPGKSIFENITDAIYSSRKTLCVISRRYLQSEWCSREIQLASFRLFDEHKDVLILLFLEEISSNQLSPFYRMRKLVKSRTYLSWTQARRHKGLFWEKVRRALECGHEPGDNHNPLTANA